MLRAKDSEEQPKLVMFFLVGGVACCAPCQENTEITGGASSAPTQKRPISRAQRSQQPIKSAKSSQEQLESFGLLFAVLSCFTAVLGCFC